MVGDSSSSYKIDNVTQVYDILNPEGHQNSITGSKLRAVLLKGLILPVGGVASVKGLCTACVAGLFPSRLSISKLDRIAPLIINLPLSSIITFFQKKSKN